MSSMATDGSDESTRGSVDVTLPSMDGIALRGRFWSQPSPRGVLIISHGLGEHGGSYRRTARSIGDAAGIDVLAFDYRGSGRSPGKRGVVRSYNDLSLDLAGANRWVSLERPSLPRFLLGHSNGGLIALRTVLDHQLGLTGLIVSNPSLKISAYAPLWKRMVGEVLLRVAPRITLTTGLANEQLTQDPFVLKEIAEDPLRHSRISPPLYFGMTAAGPILMARASEFKIPTLMILGGLDPIVVPEVGHQFFDRMGSADKTLKIYPEMRHEPLNEVGRDGVLAEVVQWIDAHLSSKA